MRTFHQELGLAVDDPWRWRIHNQERITMLGVWNWTERQLLESWQQSTSKWLLRVLRARIFASFQTKWIYILELQRIPRLRKNPLLLAHQTNGTCSKCRHLRLRCQRLLLSRLYWCKANSKESTCTRSRSGRWCTWVPKNKRPTRKQEHWRSRSSQSYELRRRYFRWI